jgi:hypothetical protein
MRNCVHRPISVYERDGIQHDDLSQFFLRAKHTVRPAKKKYSFLKTKNNVIIIR